MIMKFYFKRIFFIVCKCYSSILEILENFFLRRNFKSKYKLNKDGFLKISKNSKLNILKHKFDFILTDNQESFFANKYHKRYILSQENLNSLIKLIFDEQFCNFLTSKTGFRYSIDYFGAYQNFAIPEKEQHKPFFANHYHLDKPCSKNMLKIFIPCQKLR